ncbi:hypothetical protein DMO24_10130 [Modestobacter versicolor]|uniref:Uncharacterized protein n=1 Tax=Modestobacter versicolor TaxID=429133 RepID=A0A323V9F5_9ACTN|nr:hypothetical protein DMO24_10130 [Modestobacter versicolor]
MRCAAVSAALLGLAACAQQPGQRPGGPAGTPRYVELRPMPSEPVRAPEELVRPLPDELLESLEAPPVTMAMIEAVDRLRAAAGDSPDSGGPGISLDRTQVYLRWHGPVPAAVQAVVDRYAGAPFTVEVRSVPFPPGEVFEEAGRLLTEHPAVTSTSPRDDGIDVMIHPEVVEAAGGLHEALARHGIVSRFPLFPRAEGPVVPI